MSDDDWNNGPAWAKAVAEAAKVSLDDAETLLLHAFKEELGQATQACIATLTTMDDAHPSGMDWRDATLAALGACYKPFFYCHMAGAQLLRLRALRHRLPAFAVAALATHEIAREATRAVDISDAGKAVSESYLATASAFKRLLEASDLVVWSWSKIEKHGADVFADTIVDLLATLGNAILCMMKSRALDTRIVER